MSLPVEELTKRARPSFLFDGVLFVLCESGWVGQVKPNRVVTITWSYVVVLGVGPARVVYGSTIPDLRTAIKGAKVGTRGGTKGVGVKASPKGV